MYVYIYFRYAKINKNIEPTNRLDSFLINLELCRDSNLVPEFMWRINLLFKFQMCHH